ncbi:MAG: ATP-binding protein [Proteobacteria bacterium]|nr:(4Fe-4S)-binding protein [Desulfobacula sp.]MBU3953069.1 ATP-binding protein [Pseudomonadota bacterium]MBU4132353.1 ATP-binding protein [Pseudomonadota bacterium]
MIISIASGKGGTGKTTVATNLSCCIPEPTTLLDCDVEEPNSHLFLTPNFTGRENVIAPIPEVDDAKCTYCKRCMDICRFGAIAVVAKKVLTFPELCHSCGGCMAICPEDAIREKDRVLGIIETGFVHPKTDNGKKIQFAHGLMDIGQVMAPPIIRQVRTHADPKGVTIIDAPPGTSCPVIAAMKGADFVLLVTEPTPFGLHDLTLAVETVKILDIPHGLVINRAGMGNDDVKAYARKEKIPVLMEIPFDRKIAAAYSKGELIISCLPEYKEKFLRLYDDIKTLVAQRRQVR